MPTPISLPGVTLRTQGFAGGANIRDAVNLMASNEARPIENIVLDERGGAQKRRGCLTTGPIEAAATRILSMYTFYRGPTNVPHVLIHTTAGKLMYTAAPDVAPINWVAIKTGLSTTVPMSYETYVGKVWMGNGVDPYCSWDGAGFLDYPSAPRGRYHRLWKERMWISGVTGLNDRVYASDQGTASVFSISEWIDIGAGDGDHVRALATDGQALIVGKHESTYIIHDPVNFEFRLIDAEKGFESHFATITFEGSLYFLSRRGICQYMGDSASVVISERIEPAFIAPFLNVGQTHKATCYTFLNRIGFAIPESGESKNTLVVEYYPRLAGVTQTGARSIGPFVFHRMPVQCFARWHWPTAGKDLLFAGHNNANKMLDLFSPVGTDDGVAFQAMLQTAWFDFGDPIHTKYLRELRFLCGGRFDVLIFRNYAESIYRTITVDAGVIEDLWNAVDDVWGAGEWGTSDPTRDIRKTNIDAYARHFSFRFQDAFETDTSQQTYWIGSRDRDLLIGEWAIYGMVAEGTVLGKRT